MTLGAFGVGGFLNEQAGWVGRASPHPADASADAAGRKIAARAARGRRNFKRDISRLL
jgi:hypothetical protein